MELSDEAGCDLCHTLGDEWVPMRLHLVRDDAVEREETSTVHRLCRECAAALRGFDVFALVRQLERRRYVNGRP